jgi:HSP20 family molecular chaperone IbpA
MSDPDDIDEVLRDLRRFSQTTPERFDIDDGAFECVPDIEAETPGDVPEDELILGDDYITYLVFAEERRIEDFYVSTAEDHIEVKTEDFTVKKELRTRVDRDEPQTTYTNGILSIRLRRLGDRDAEP